MKIHKNLNNINKDQMKVLKMKTIMTEIMNSSLNELHCGLEIKEKIFTEL